MEKKAQELLREEYLTMLVIGRASEAKFQGMRDKIEKPLLFGQDLTQG